ncbi:cupin domain-containing protein [Streptomyces sp. bgisy022]|uniref:cupin domain-containing protein n=1 Tax=Streptomyces sp. bgisy022 TaxID=3413769 RepID=UPI003D7519A1
MRSPNGTNRPPGCDAQQHPPERPHFGLPQLRAPVDGTAHRITAGDTVIVNPGTTLAVENPTARPAAAWVTTSRGLRATLADGTRLTPPWAN